jgi:8-oxo-dGTP diphosphatase
MFKGSDIKDMTTVTAGILFKGAKVFIARRKPAGIMPGKWEFPGGKVEDGETPEEGLERELEEELEIDAVVGDCLGENVHHYDFGTVKLLFYRVHWDGGEISSKDHDEYGWVPLDELSNYDFVPADWPFVKELMSAGVVSQKHLK